RVGVRDSEVVHHRHDGEDDDERPDPRLGPYRPEDAAGDEDQARGEDEDRQLRICDPLLSLADDVGDDQRRTQRRPRPPRAWLHAATSASNALDVSSDFGTKPATGRSSRTAPRSATVRLDVSTTSGRGS